MRAGTSTAAATVTEAAMGRNTATGAWRENIATATTASARTGLGYRAKATEEAAEEEDTTEEEEQ